MELSRSEQRNGSSMKSARDLLISMVQEDGEKDVRTRKINSVNNTLKRAQQSRGHRMDGNNLADWKNDSILTRAHILKIPIMQQQLSQTHALLPSQAHLELPQFRSPQERVDSDDQPALIVDAGARLHAVHVENAGCSLRASRVVLVVTHVDILVSFEAEVQSRTVAHGCWIEPWVTAWSKPGAVWRRELREKQRELLFLPALTQRVDQVLARGSVGHSF